VHNSQPDGGFLMLAGQPDAPLRILALGDSYTIGEGGLPDARWPMQLVARLRSERGLQVAEPLIIARTGWTTDELWGALEQAALPAGFDLVTLLAGVNDQYRGRPLPGYEAQFTRLLARAVALAGGHWCFPSLIGALPLLGWHLGA
jgi:lysophospholipase L1-like esterase